VIKWIATLSDGSRVTEGEGDFTLIPGERTPWFRLTEQLNKKGLYLTRLVLDVNGKEVSLPNDAEFYSLCYHIEGVLGSGGIRSKKFVEGRAHYSDRDFVLLVSEDADFVARITEPTEGLAPTPKSDLQPV
jgi:hypothetical protein